MKKILLLLVFIFSFAYSRSTMDTTGLTKFNSLDSALNYCFSLGFGSSDNFTQHSQPVTYYYQSGYFVYVSGNSAQSGVSWLIDNGHGGADLLISVALIKCQYAYPEGHKILDLNTHQCIDKTSCLAPNTIVNNVCQSPACPQGQISVNGQCFQNQDKLCIDGYVPDKDGKCIPDCNNVNYGFTDYSGFSSYIGLTQDQCIAKAVQNSSDMHFETKTVQNSSGLNCSQTNCVLSQDLSCTNSDDPSNSLQDGFIFKGTVQSDVQCSQYVDGVNYLDYYTKFSYPNCNNGSNVVYTRFCYLEPSVDNNDSGVTDYNTTAPISNINNNDVNYTNNSNDSIAKTNSYLSQISSDTKTNINTQITNDNSNTQNIVNNNNLNANKIVDALNSQTDTLNNTLLSLNSGDGNNSQIDYTDKLNEEINATNGIKDILSGWNDSNDSSLLSDSFSLVDFYTNMKSDLDNYNTQFTDLKSTLENGFNTPTLSTGMSPVFTTQAFGKTFTLNLSFFSTFRPILSFIFTVLFLVLALRIYLSALKIN